MPQLNVVHTNSKVGQGHNSDKMLQNTKMLQSEKGRHLVKYLQNQIFAKSYSGHLQNFMNLALGVLQIFCLQDFPMLKYLSMKRGHNLIQYL